jgi:protein SCO1/2
VARLSGGALLPYHLGRITTYAALAERSRGCSACCPKAISPASPGRRCWRWRRWDSWDTPCRAWGRLPVRAGDGWVAAIDRLARPLFARPVGWRGYLLGVALGFIPCGLVYAALAAAAASADPLGGVFAMAAFGLGTVPALIGVGVAGTLAAERWRGLSARLLPVLFLANAALLLALAWGLATERDETVGGPFALVAPDHRVVTDRDFRGKVLLVYFGYTFCPDVCPTSLANIADAIDLLPPEKRRKVAAVYISVDPERDTPEILGEYTAHFHPQILGLTGAPDRIAEVARAYRASYARVEGQGAAEYLMDHSTAIYLMDGEGLFIRHFAHTVEPRLLARALETAIGDLPCPHPDSFLPRPPRARERLSPPWESCAPWRGGG